MQDVQQQIDEAKEGKQPPIEDLWNNIYVDPLVSPQLCRCHALTSGVQASPAISSATSSSCHVQRGMLYSAASILVLCWNYSQWSCWERG